MLTLELLQKTNPGAVIASGICLNRPDDVYMTDHNIGKKMIWIAKRGGIDDWCIYCGWEEDGFNHCLTNGQKIMTEIYIRRLVPCDEETFKRYRR